ncbi:DUF3667 domain-containing protein [Marivirga salinae]|uniref:DUF3667 domain-containing protein n=1 Tax=Marivirga salinarum TaxID=3059078 RepID=A0AA49GH32_9BACT|nr:DUF3667 domain-containing protein [Marivirga sp. BDSF4-3]WKK76741.1 DUF3667 domain-containing protein [Marivirga sp. BDSF4-3]
MENTTNKKELEKSENQSTLERIDGKYIWREFVSVLIFEKGILFTIKELFVRPGDTIREFLHYDRSKLVKPISFLIFSSLVLIIIHNILGLKTDRAPQHFDSNGAMIALEWIEDNYEIVIILSGIFIGLWTSLFFIKSSFNIYEIFILVFFTTGIVSLICTLFKIVESITGFESSYLSLIIPLFYSTWAIGNFFNKNKFLSYFKGFLAYLFGSTMLPLFIIIIGLLLDVFSKSN